MTPLKPIYSAESAFFSQLYDRLFPITRSITGPGLRESLGIFAEYMPLTFDGVPSGAQVFDWTTPPEWSFESARLIGPDGSVIVDAADNNLHVVNYSVPMERTCSLQELQPYLHSIPDQPDLVPYVTSYYHDNWGFCLSDRARSSLAEGDYRVEIRTAKYAGEGSFADTVLPGDSESEFLLSSYLCHPSMANNELSGPLVLLGLYHRLAQWPRRRFTYRFVLLPETIGSLCYLFRCGEHLKDALIGGLVLTCLGGNKDALSYKISRREDTVLDRLVRDWAERNPADWTLRPFDPSGGSDERQYCSPGFNLPVGQVARTVYGDYPEYHTSGDDKAFMDVGRIVEAVDRIERLLIEHEYAGVFVNQSPFGEVQLGKRGLYPSINSPAEWTRSSDGVFDGRLALRRIMTILNYADGKSSMIEIARRLDCSVEDLRPLIDRLEEENLLKAA